jgi:glycosyltransferase involved in cell wall biosynthesis
VTGTVPDVRPYLWGSSVSVVPLRIGGGTRLKIFEAMAARVPVVSTSVGAEGLPLKSGKDIAIADCPEHFARCCLDLLADADLRRHRTNQAWELVSSRFSWEAVSRRFEWALKAGPRPN